MKSAKEWQAMMSARDWAATLRDCRPGAFWTLVEDIRAEQREAIAAELRRAAKEVKRTTGSDDFADGYRCAADIAEKFGEDKP